jgi:hypothetical protein
MLIEAAPDAVNMVNHIGDTAILCRFRKKEKHYEEILREILSCSLRCGVTVKLDTPGFRISTPIDEALFLANTDLATLLLAHGAKLQNNSVLTMLSRIKNRKDADINISACLNAVLQHALERGSAVLPAAPIRRPAVAPAAAPAAAPGAVSHVLPREKPAAVQQVMATEEKEAEEEEEEEPVRKRRRRQ